MTQTQSGYSSSIDTGLPAIPDLNNIQQPDKLAYNFIQVYNAISTLAQSIDSYTGNSPQPTSVTNSNIQPVESTVLVGNTSNLWCNAQTALLAGYAVKFVNVSGVLNAAYAQASALSNMCYGITMTAAAINTPVQVLLLGLFNFGGSVIPGSLYYLSPTVAGGITTTSPATSGQIIQPVGYGLDTDSIFFNPSLNPQVHP